VKKKGKLALKTPDHLIQKVVERDTASVPFEWEPFRFQRDGVNWKYDSAVHLQPTYDSILVSLDPTTRLVTHVYIFQVTIQAKYAVNLNVLVEIHRIYEYVQWENMSFIFLHPVFGKAMHASVTTPNFTGAVDHFKGRLEKMTFYDAEWDVRAAMDVASTGDNRPKFSQFLSQQFLEGVQERLFPVKNTNPHKEDQD
jgi:hypothetical protein